MNRTRIACILFALLWVCLCSPVTALADVIYEPMDDFYLEHAEQCEYHSRSYTAAGPNGNVTLYESPESAQVQGTAPNGQTLFVSYTYSDEDGILWGFCENWETGLMGWAPMDYLALIYDGISFEEEFGEAFVSIERTLDGDDLTGKTVYFVEYPGSGAYIPAEMGQDGRPQFQTSYTDANGVEWVRCGYYRGIKGYWINWNDPTSVPAAQERPETGAEETESGERVVEEIVPKEPARLKITRVVLIAAVAMIVAVTWTMIRKLKKTK